MYILPLFDNRTLISCDLMLATIFAIVFFSTHRVYPNLRGVRCIAVSFFLAVPGTLLLASRGNIPYFVSVIFASAFLLGSFLFLYRGMLRFLGVRRSMAIPCAAASAAMAVIYYYSQVRENIVPRIVVFTVSIGLIRGLIALELFRKAPTFPNPKTMRLFAWSIAFFSAVNINCGIFTVLHGAPSNSLQSSVVGSVTLLLGVVSNFTTGLFVLILCSSELIARSRDESQKDALSGVFNRRGIEAKLAAELKHFHRGDQRLSIALIDVDHFKSINDVQGHAAGDAAIRDVALAISGRLRGRDYLGRYGGDEFLLILPQTAASVALVVAERLSQTVSNLGLSGGNQLTLSVGVTEAVSDEDAVSLIARADKALYQAKTDGRNCRRVITVACSTSLEGALENPSLGEMLMPGIDQTVLR